MSLSKVSLHSLLQLGGVFFWHTTAQAFTHFTKHNQEADACVYGWIVLRPSTDPETLSIQEEKLV